MMKNNNNSFQQANDVCGALIHMWYRGLSYNPRCVN